ncbi:DUF6210 family protein [Flavobacterium alkalisoli]|uniref:DUF6210 family protein n=1 Tax=Flavobacterium alkalisoli TaxID=2602769 RepID=UPI003A946BEB
MSNPIKPSINLFDAIGLGLIIKYPTGVLITNQTAGTLCLQSAEEGIYVPLCNEYYTDSKELISPENDLLKYFTESKYHGTGATEGIDKEDVLNITNILIKYKLDDFIEIDTEKLKQSHEAWIYVKINNKNTSVFNNFEENLTGILTWSNSD